MDVQLLCKNMKQAEKENNIHRKVVIPKGENGVDPMNLAGGDESLV